MSKLYLLAYSTHFLWKSLEVLKSWNLFLKSENFPTSQTFLFIYFILFFFFIFRTIAKRQLWGATKEDRHCEDKAERQIRTAQVGNRRPCGVHLRWAPTRRDVLRGGSRRPRRQAWKRGLNLSDHKSQKGVPLCVDFCCLKNLCSRRGLESLSQWSDRRSSITNVVRQLWWWRLCLWVPGC